MHEVFYFSAIEKIDLDRKKNINDIEIKSDELQDIDCYKSENFPKHDTWDVTRNFF